jgi:hypothetical protein
MRENSCDRPWRSSLLTSKHLWSVGLAIAVLVLGALVYVIDRPVGSAVGLTWLMGRSGSSVFGALGGSLPTFAHTFAFSLVSCLLLPAHADRAAGIGRCCALWAAVEIVFECLQHPALGLPLATHLKQLAPSGSLPDTLAVYFANYFAHGRFDPLDVIAACLGAAASFGIATGWLGHRVRRLDPAAGHRIPGRTLP